MLCKNCGAELPDGTAKCQFCGAELEEEQNVEEIEENETPEEEFLDENEIKRREQMEKMMAEKQQQLSEIEKRRNIKKKRQRQTKIAIVCAICVACVAAVGLGSYFVKESMKQPEPTPIPIATIAPAVIPTPVPVTTTPVPLETVIPTGSPERTWNSTGNNNTSLSGGTSGNSSSGTGTNTSSGRGTSGGNSGSSSSGNTSDGRTNSTSGSAGTLSSSSGSSGGSSGGSSSYSVNNSPASSATASGASTNNISAQLTRGGEVIYNNATGKYLMTFTVGNTLYYANVSSGSTTEQIKDKDITITAHATGDKYNGNTVYEITGMTYYDAKDYIIPQSGTKLLTKEDIKNLSKEQLALARNEIYARHGRKFQMAEFRDYFSQKAWYKENPNYNYNNESSNLNEIEAKNVVFLLSAENSK